MDLSNIKRLIIMAVAAMISITTSYAQWSGGGNSISYENPLNIARDFGDKLSTWVNTSSDANKIKRKKELDSMQGRIKIRVWADNARHIAALRNHPTKQNYEWANYTNNILFAIINPGGTTLTCDKFKVVDADKFPSWQKIPKGANLVSFEMRFSGKFNDHEKCLLYIRDNKITGLEHYTEVKGKIKINMDAFDEETEGLEIAGIYTPHFPAGVSIAYGKWLYTIGVEFGVNADNKIHTSTKINATDPVNYDITRTQCDPKFYLGVIGGLRMKYVGISCGYGIVQFKERTDSRQFHTSVSDDYIVTTSGTQSQTSTSSGQYLQPAVHGYIPVSDHCSISLRAGYHFCFGHKELNGVLAGAGISWIF